MCSSDLYSQAYTSHIADCFLVEGTSELVNEAAYQILLCHKASESSSSDKGMFLLGRASSICMTFMACLRLPLL